MAFGNSRRFNFLSIARKKAAHDLGTEISMNEKRSPPRRLVKKSATIMLGGGRKVICGVRDLSKLGAGLDIAAEVYIPDVFKLVLEMETVQRRCKIAWRKDNRLGVTFLP